MQNQYKLPSKRPLIIGVFLFAIGLFLFVQTQGLFQGFFFWWPIIFVFCGLFLLYRFFFCKSAPRLLFIGLFLFLTGMFIFLVNTLAHSFSLSMKELWPTFMGIVGFSLLCYATQYQNTAKISLAIPAIFLIFLMGVSFLFSFSVVDQPLLQLLQSFWPIILLFLGLILIVNYCLELKEKKGSRKDSS